MAASYTIILATRNPGKVAELDAMLGHLPLKLVSAAELNGAPDVIEDAETLRGNAEKKARALFEFSGMPALADDTGLEVDSLAGAPGVHSARYAGEEANDQANRTKLLADLKDAENRLARFRTVLSFVDESGVRFFDGTCEGVITDAERGTNGFGYDSIFQPLESEGETFAEMSAAQKNLISHRGRALRSFTTFLESKLGSQ